MTVSFANTEEDFARHGLELCACDYGRFPESKDCVTWSEIHHVHTEQSLG